MKKVTVRAGQIINSMFAGIITLLGFSSCGNEECMYGTPTSYYEIKGTVTEESGHAVEGAKVIMRRINGNSAYTARGDTAITDIHFTIIYHAKQRSHTLYTNSDKV